MNIIKWVAYRGYLHITMTRLQRWFMMAKSSLRLRKTFFTKKHDLGFPARAINYCLGEAFIESSELDAVVFYDSPLLSLDRMIKNAVTAYPDGRGQFIRATRALLGKKPIL